MPLKVSLGEPTARLKRPLGYLQCTCVRFATIMMRIESIRLHRSDTREANVGVADKRSLHTDQCPRYKYLEQLSSVPAQQRGKGKMSSGRESTPVTSMLQSTFYRSV